MSVDNPTETSKDGEIVPETQTPPKPPGFTDTERGGAADPIPNRGLSDITFGDLNDDHTNPDTLYDRVIIHNGYTCGNCFARLGRQWELPNTKQTEDLADLTSYIHREIPYQIPPDNRDPLDDRYYQSERFGDRAGFIPAAGKYTPTKRILICYTCGHQVTSSPGPTTYGIYRGATAPDGITYTPARAWRFNEDDEDTTRTRDNPRTKAEAIHAAHRLSHTLSEYDIEHDMHVLIEIVRQNKSISACAKRDDAIFKRAVAAAVRSARHFDTDVGLRRP